MGTNQFAYDAVGELLSENGPWANDTVSYTYTNRLRASLSLLQPSGTAWTNGYSYDITRRLTGVTSQAGAFGYGYDVLRQMQVAKLTLANGSYITNAYDSVARLLSTALKNSGDTNLDSYAYTYNVGNQRTGVIRTTRR